MVEDTQSIILTHKAFESSCVEESEGGAGGTIEGDTDIGACAIAVLATVTGEAGAGLCVTEACSGGVGAAFCIGGAGCAEVIFADLTATIVVIAAISGGTSATEAEATEAALCIEGAGRAEVVDADLTACALAICAAIACDADLIDAELALSALCIGGAGEAAVILADLSTGAVAILEAVFAAIDGEVAFLTAGALAIVAAARSALAGIADIALAALAVNGTGNALILLANLSILAMLVDGALFTGEIDRIADTVIGAIGIVAASGAAEVIEADLALCALVIATAACDAKLCIAVTDLCGILAVDIIGTGHAGELSADAAIGAIGIGETLTAGIGCDLADLAVGAFCVGAATIAATFGRGVADLAGVTLCIGGAIGALILFADLSIWTVLVIEALDTDEGLGVTDAASGAIGIGAATIAATFGGGIADLAVVASGVGGAIFTFILSADLSILAVGVIAAIALCADAAEADISSGAVVVIDAASAGILSADLAILAVGILEAAFAGVVFGIAALVISAIFVFTATSAAFSIVADLACVALCVAGAGGTVVIDTGEAICTIAVITAISGGTSAIEAEGALGAIAIRGAARTFVVFADLSILAVFVFEAIAIDAGTGSADLSLSTARIITASDAAVGIADFSVFTIAIVHTIAANACGGIADASGTLLIFEAFNAGIICGVAELPILAIGILATTGLALLGFTDTTGAAFCVIFAGGAFVVFADLAIRAGRIGAVAIAFFAHPADADITLVALLIGLAGATHAIRTDCAATAILVVFTT